MKCIKCSGQGKYVTYFGERTCDECEGTGMMTPLNIAIFSLIALMVLYFIWQLLIRPFL